ncbi:hypothetical protein GO730_33930 [Spirosoma sp. HMF3257]|nr:hypothetical protein [Spirosoma telluris]
MQTDRISIQEPGNGDISSINGFRSICSIGHLETNTTPKANRALHHI